jgi:hypothetical protein
MPPSTAGLPTRLIPGGTYVLRAALPMCSKSPGSLPSACTWLTPATRSMPSGVLPTCWRTSWGWSCCRWRRVPHATSICCGRLWRHSEIKHKVAVEFRRKEWLNEETLALLGECGAAFVSVVGLLRSTVLGLKGNVEFPA